MSFFSGLQRRDVEAPAMVALHRLDSDARRRDRLKLFRAIDANPYLRECYALHVMEQIDADVARGALVIAADAPPEGRVIRIIQWCIDNQDKILAFAQLLIALFSGLQVARDEPRPPDVSVAAPQYRPETVAFPARPPG